MSVAEAFSQRKATAQEAWSAFQDPPRPWVGVAIDTGNIASGARELLASLRQAAADGKMEVDVHSIGSRGIDYMNPCVEVAWPGGARVLMGKVAPGSAEAILKALAEGRMPPGEVIGVVAGDVPDAPPLSAHPWFAAQERRMTERCGLIDPESIEHYIATEGYAVLADILDEKRPVDAVLEELGASELWGRSGSAFPTARKWEFLRQSERDRKYLLCNADEGDPGQWPNRILMENDPHSIIEGMLLSAYCTDATDGFIYIRDEYPLAVERMEKAVADAYEWGLLGDSVLGSELSFHVRVIRGMGSYVVGEESGLIASLEDARAMPKIRPPYPAQSGVFGYPSNVNNVETYALAPLILRKGAEWWTSVGSGGEKGTLLFTLSGDIQKTGSLELPLGAPLRVLYETAGGVAPGREVKAIQAGGPLSGLLPADLDMPMTRAAFREKGAGIGGGGVVFIDDTACVVDLNVAFQWFLEDESCGRCTTCFAGTRRLLEMLRRIAAGRGRTSDLQLIRMLGSVMRYSNCAHGQAAPTILLNSLTYFPEEVEEHIVRKRCPAKKCPELTRYEVLHHSDRLPLAEAICPTEAVVRGEDERYHIDQAKCIKCGACREQAPYAIDVVDVNAP